MGQKKYLFKENDVISASEIGQYHFCSISWFLQRCGYTPQSPSLNIGLKKHKRIGNIIDNIQVREKKSRLISIIGYCLLFLAIVILLFEVVI